MVSPGDNMALTEPEYPPEFLKECKNCPHPRWEHLDRAGCNGIKDAKTPAEAFPPYERCHCTNFEVKNDA